MPQDAGVEAELVNVGDNNDRTNGNAICLFMFSYRGKPAPTTASGMTQTNALAGTNVFQASAMQAGGFGGQLIFVGHGG